MNKFFIMMIGLLFTASAVFASPNAKADFVTLDKADSQVLFGDSAVSVVALGHDEMMTTEGEWGGVFRALTYSSLWARVPANAPSYGGRIYGHAPAYVGRYSVYPKRANYMIQWNLMYR